MTGLRHNAAALAVLAVGLPILLFFEWHTDEPTVVLPVLLLVAFLAGLALPSRYLLLGLCLGWAIPIAHALSAATGTFIPAYQTQPPSTADWLVMAALVLPAVAAAFGGSRLAAVIRRPLSASG